MRFDEAARADVQARLARFDRRPLDPGDLRHAAVACVIVPAFDGSTGFVITRRAARTPAHPGQWALPGGRLHDGESTAEAARRELAEETGLVVGPDAVLGLLDDYQARSGHLITPVVMWGGADPSFTPDPREVSELHCEPFETLAGPGVPRLIEIEESDRPVIQLPLRDTFVHAPTAAVLYQFYDVAIAGGSVRVADYEQPVFAWR